MSTKRLSDETRFQIALAALSQRATVAEICNEFGISEATYYRIRDDALETLRTGLTSRRKGGREAQLERENRRLKELVADYAAAVHILKKIRSDNKRGNEVDELSIYEGLARRETSFSACKLRLPPACLFRTTHGREIGRAS